MDEKRVVHIVDDEDSIRRSTGFMLKKSGFSVTPWVSGVEFLKKLKQAEQGCILLDVRMPEMDGLEVQQELKARGISMRSEEQTYELQSIMRISYAVFCLKKTNKVNTS